MTKNTCTRCGKCCVSGGPSLHVADIPLLQGGMLRAAHLVTIRAGELVRQFDASLKPTPVELIKIQGASASSWSCRFFMKAGEGSAHASMCLLHGRHPEECRVLFCTDPDPLVAMYEQDRLDRKQVITALVPEEWQEALLGLIDAHEEACSYTAVSGLSVQEQQDHCRLDVAFRELAMEKAGLDADELPFYFGRSLASLLQQVNQPKERTNTTGTS